MRSLARTNPISSRFGLGRYLHTGNRAVEMNRTSGENVPYRAARQFGQRGGRGRGRGRSGWDRGNGNWRGGNQASQDAAGSTGVTSGWNGPKPKLTHFLSIPLGHLSTVRSVTESFGAALLAHTPPITGLDPTVVVAPRRLHLTLGVMSLVEETSAAQDFSGPEPQNSKTVSSALTILRSLRPTILRILDGHPLRVPLTCVDIMKPERNDPTRAHVLFTGPADEDLKSEDGQRLKHVCELVNSEFVNSGLIVDEKRSLKLHCTLINTSNRKPRGNGRRTPFSYAEIRDCAVVRDLIASGSQQREAVGSARKVVKTGNNSQSEFGVEFGIHTVSEIQICRMGSWGAEGEYICEGKIEL